MITFYVYSTRVIRPFWGEGWSGVKQAASFRTNGAACFAGIPVTTTGNAVAESPPPATAGYSLFPCPIKYMMATQSHMKLAS